MMSLRRFFPPTVALGLLALGATAPAQSQGFAQKTKTIRAAVLVLDSDKIAGAVHGQTAAPFAFYNLDQATGVKPDGWTFTNPYAPGVVTPEIRSRYAETYGLDPNNPPAPGANFPVPLVNASIGKKQAAYWTVRLSRLNESQLANYDVLLIAPRYGIDLNSSEREKLRRFVDGGGVLWVDLLGAALNNRVSDANNLPNALQVAAGANSAAYQDSTSPLLNGLRQVSGADLGYLTGSSAFAIGPVGNTDLNNSPQFAEFSRYRGVAWTDNTANPVIAEARLGEGTIVVTARGAAEMLNKVVVSGPALQLVGNTTNANVGYQALPLGGTPQLNAQGRAAARLAVNIVSLGTNFRQQNGGPRNTSSASTDPGAPVLPRFTIEGAHGPANAITGRPNGVPVTFKGYLVATYGNRFAVYDAIPGRDLDGDGDPDDGIVSPTTGQVDNTLRDVSVGKTLDLVWVSGDLGARLSPPVCAEIPEAPAGRVDQVLATDATGRLHIMPLIVTIGANRLVVGGQHDDETIVNPPNGNSIGSSAPISPVVHNGLAYVTDSQTGGVGSGNLGRVWVADLSTGVAMKSTLVPDDGAGNVWRVGGTGAGGNPLPQFTAAPTIGEIPINDNSGGSDRVMYVPGVFGTGTQPGFVSLWLGAKGEVPDSWTIDGTVSPRTLRITTRAGAAAQLPLYSPQGGASAVQRQLGVHLTIVDQAGNPQRTSDFITGGPVSVAQGTVSYPLSSALTEQQIRDRYEFRIDYTIDWGYSAATYSATIQRGNYILPVRKLPLPADSSKRILGSIAMTGRGTLHMTEGTPLDPSLTTPEKIVAPRDNAGGTYWAIREDAGNRGQFRVLSRYTLHEAYTQSFGSAGGTAVRSVLEDADAVQGYLPPFIRNGAFTNFYFSGGVAVRNGVAFAAINATRAGVLPVAMVAAFRAEPETAELRIGANLGTNPVLQQADFARSYPSGLVRQPNLSRLSGAALNVDVDNGIIRIENLAGATIRGEITDCLSQSQPVGVGAENRGFTLREPDREGDRWSPLLWFGLWNGGTATATPLVAGNEVFLPAASFLPSLLSTIAEGNTPSFTPLPATSGVIWSVDADTTTNNLFSVPNPLRPWIIQQAQVSTNAGVFQASPYYRMPQSRGSRDFPDYAVRLNQTKLGASTTVLGVGGGDGVVAAYGDGGLYGLSRADFVVADEGRLLRVDSAGNVMRNAYGGRFNGIGNGGAVSEQRNLVRPVKAYPVGTNETLVVDAGANRIMRIDEDGTVLRSLDRILLDPKFKPTNYRVNQPLTFKDPRDATTFEGYVYRAAGDPEVVTDQGTTEYWIRYLVADSGNGRLVELADRFMVDAQGRIGAPVTVDAPDPETGIMIEKVPQVGVLVWQSPSLENKAQTGDFYHSVSRVYLGSVGTGRYVYVAGVGRSRPTSASVGLDNPGVGVPTPLRPSSNGGGAVVVFDPLGGTRVFDRFTAPDLSNVPFLADPTTTPPAFGRTRASAPSQVRPFSGIVNVSASSAVEISGPNAGQAAVRVMVTDMDAVYEFYLNGTLLGNPTGSIGALTPTWMINEAAFLAIRQGTVDGLAFGGNPLQFRPAYARRLDSGEVIVVNGYRGLTFSRQSTYSGEVVLLDGTPNLPAGSVQNLGFKLSSVRFELPPLEGIRGLVSPVFADRR